jgi:hypothetical protein
MNSPSRFSFPKADDFPDPFGPARMVQIGFGISGLASHCHRLAPLGFVMLGAVVYWLVAGGPARLQPYFAASLLGVLADLHEGIAILMDLLQQHLILLMVQL